MAVSVVTESAVPSAEILQKVIGTQDVLLWLAGMDIGLTEAEREAYPKFATYLAEGYIAGGIDGLLAERVRMTVSVGAAAAELGTTMMMMELNYDLLFGIDLSAAGLMGLE